MREKLTVIKVGGKIVEEEATLLQLLNDFMSADRGKVIQQLKKGGFLFYDFSTHLNYS